MKDRFLKIFFILFLTCLFGCSSAGPQEPFRGITQEEAVTMMEGDCTVIDVRTPSEYAQGHIPNAINLPVETIEETAPKELPDKERLLLLYCRTGVRSKQAAGILAKLGYTNVCEFGGIADWKGDIVTDFHYTDEPECNLIVEVNGTQLSAVLADNEAGNELKKRLTEEKEIELHLSEYGSFEKVGPLPWPLPTEDERITSEVGDIFLYQGDQITIFYGQNTWSYTRLGHILGMTQNELKEIFGVGDVTVKLFLDWLDY